MKKRIQKTILGCIATAFLTLSLSSTAFAQDPSAQDAARNMARLIGDELTLTPADKVGNCYVATGATVMIMKDSAQFNDDMKVVMGLQLLVWSDVKARKEANGVVVGGTLAEKIKQPNADFSAMANDILTETGSCTKLFTTAMQTASTKMKAQ